MQVSTVSIDEYVELLKRSNLPTVVTEGREDYLVFRRLEEELQVSFLPVGGKDNVIKLYERRADFKQIKTAFIADKDIWVFSGVPEQFGVSGFFCTNGYSIENDLYRDGHLESLLLPDERSLFQRDLDQLLKWFSFALQERINGKPVPFKYHPDQMLCDQGRFKENFLALAQYEENSTGPMYEILVKDYARLFRGKTLLSLLVRYLSHSKRAARHNSRSLLEIGCLQKGENLLELLRGLKTHFKPC